MDSGWPPYLVRGREARSGAVSRNKLLFRLIGAVLCIAIVVWLLQQWWLFLVMGLGGASLGAGVAIVFWRRR